MLRENVVFAYASKQSGSKNNGSKNHLPQVPGKPNTSMKEVASVML
jgi:hypothetical protein